MSPNLALQPMISETEIEKKILFSFEKDATKKRLRMHLNWGGGEVMSLIGKRI
jgi:hypothetical protein